MDKPRHPQVIRPWKMQPSRKAELFSQGKKGAWPPGEKGKAGTKPFRPKQG